MKKALLFGCLILIGACVIWKLRFDTKSTPGLTSQGLLRSEQFIQEGSNIYISDDKTGSKTLFQSDAYLVGNRDETEIVIYYARPMTVGIPEDRVTLMAYSLKDQAHTELYKANEFIRYRTAHISPNGDYIVVGAGSDVVGGGQIFRYPEAGLITNFVWYSDRLKWVDDYTFAYDQPTETGFYRPAGGGTIPSLATVDIRTGTVELLGEATPTTEYQLWKVEDGYVYYQKTTVPTPEDWFSDKEVKTAWKVRLSDQKPIQLDEGPSSVYELND